MSQTTGEVRLRWDPFIRRQRFLDDAVQPAKGVRTATTHRVGFTMVSEYVSFARADPVVLAAASADIAARGQDPEERSGT